MQFNKYKDINKNDENQSSEPRSSTKYKKISY